MIIEQVDQVLSETKTQVRWVMGPHYRMYPLNNSGDYGVYTPMKNGAWRLLYAEGHTYAVQPKRGKPAVMWMRDDIDGKVVWITPDKPFRAKFAKQGWQEGRIRITAIRQERLQEITETDAQAEGHADVAAFRAFWERTQTRAGKRWGDNPKVWVLRFELVKKD